MSRESRKREGGQTAATGDSATRAKEIHWPATGGEVGRKSGMGSKRIVSDRLASMRRAGNIQTDEIGRLWPKIAGMRLGEIVVKAGKTQKLPIVVTIPVIVCN